MYLCIVQWIEIPGGLVKGTVSNQCNAVGSDAVKQVIPAGELCTVAEQVAVHRLTVNQIIDPTLAKFGTSEYVADSLIVLFAQSNQGFEVLLDKRGRCYSEMLARVITSVRVFNRFVPAVIQTQATGITCCNSVTLGRLPQLGQFNGRRAAFGWQR